MDTRIQNRLRSLYDDQNASDLQRIETLVVPHTTSIIENFIAAILSDPVNQRFAQHNSIMSRLQGALEHWLLDLFRIRQPHEIDKLFARLQEIGKHHALISVPLVSIQLSRSLLKEELFRVMMQSAASQDEKLASLLLIDKILDLSIAIINHAFISGVVDDTRHAQSLKLQSLGMDMAMQSESLRASLFDWQRRIVTLFFLNTEDACIIPSINTTDIGLWVYHKGDLLFPESREIARLKALIREIDLHISTMFSARSDRNSNWVNDALLCLDQLVSSVASLLLTIKDHTLAMEAGRDALTKLFNRRFLHIILQRETSRSINTGQRFAVLLVDVDHFKQINDTYGHAAGDIVLSQIAEILLMDVRAGDFVFRYGGEEFLVILNNIHEAQAIKVAEKIRVRVENHRFVINEGLTLSSTVSLGIAMHDGHPDYNRTTILADRALYQAKGEGRNRWQLAGPSLSMEP